MRLKEAIELYEEGRPEEVLDLRNLSGLESVLENITNFIRSKTKKGVVGISGGVDSALTATLAVNAVGKENVHGLIMPSATTTAGETEDAIKQAEKLGVKYTLVDIQGVVDSYSRVAGFMSDIPWGRGRPSTLGNAKPRIRMVFLYGWANANGGLVIGTDNKTEGTDYGMGYFTKFGDGGVDINPIGGLYKTQVWQLAEYVGVLPSIVRRTPTAGLFLGQTDEDELGIKYRTLDKVLLGMELDISKKSIARVVGVPEQKISDILAYRRKNQHKGEVPTSVKLYGFERA